MYTYRTTLDTLEHNADSRHHMAISIRLIIRMGAVRTVDVVTKLGDVI